MGVSTRKVTEVTEQLCASASRRDAGQELEEFRNRELGEYPIVYLDARFERAAEWTCLKAGVNR